MAHIKNNCMSLLIHYGGSELCLSPTKDACHVDTNRSNPITRDNSFTYVKKNEKKQDNQHWRFIKVYKYNIWNFALLI